MARAIEYRRLRAPREHGQALIDPPLCEVAQLLETNKRIAESATTLIAGVPLGELCVAARRELFAIAQAHSRPASGIEHPPSGPFILAGHQPELFHPGVWFKNFVLAQLAARHQATAINLVADSDETRAPCIRTLGAVDAIENACYDRAHAPLPHEELLVGDEACFEAFPLTIDPRGERLVTSLWKFAPRDQKKLGLRLAIARHRLEAAHGLQSLEAPQSAVCDSPSFVRFALHLLENLAQLRDIHNAALDDYRRVHRSRSQTHPVPKLTQQGAWIETPLWIWSSERPQRRPAFASRAGQLLTLSDRGPLSIELPLRNGRVTEDTIEAWQTARNAGVKLRPRALVTTMYARLVLSDLFLHGIGGAKYDQVTDAIIERFFGITPPRYMTVTATMKLFPEFDAERIEKDLRRVEHALRELPYHSESFATSEAADRTFERLRAEKEQLVTNPPPKGQRKAWHQAIAALNAQLQAFTAARAKQLHEDRERLQQQLQQHALLGSREFSFCLFDERLPEQLKQLASLHQPEA